MSRKIHPLGLVVGPLAVIAGLMLMGRSFVGSLIPAGLMAAFLWWFYRRESN